MKNIPSIVNRWINDRDETQRTLAETPVRHRVAGVYIHVKQTGDETWILNWENSSVVLNALSRSLNKSYGNLSDFMGGGYGKNFLCFREKTRNKKKMREVRDKRANATTVMIWEQVSVG